MSHTATAPVQSHVPPLKMGVPIPNGKLGMWLFLGTEIMFFTAFIGTYIVLRLGSKGWPVDTHITHINILAGGTNTFVLITSSVFVVLAHEAMNSKRYKLATNWMIATMALACVFLVIKSIEYYGKYEHDILPGHVAESPRQALDKLATELDKASGLLPLQKEETRLNNVLARNPNDKAAATRLEDVQKKIKALDPVLEPYQKLKAKAKFGDSSLHAVHEAGDELKELQKSHPVFESVHEPHYIKWGNTFSSIYFLMTGFHALHVIIGMIMFVIIIMLGMSNKLGAQHATFVENCGLYWHFVDLVWIFLFPLIYII